MVRPLRALGGAAMAVAGVVLGLAALLSVTEAPPDPLQRDLALLVEPPPPAAGPRGGAPDDAAPAPAPLPAAAPDRAPAPRAAPSAGQRTQAGRAPRTSGGAAARPAVTVLNNSTSTGLAARAAARFRSAGWPVRLTGNFRGRLRATTVYYEPGQREAAQRFAGAFPGVPRVLPRPGLLPGPRGLTVVLTRHYPA